MSTRGVYYEIQDLNTNIHIAEQKYCYNDENIDQRSKIKIRYYYNLEISAASMTQNNNI